MAEHEGSAAPAAGVKMNLESRLSKLNRGVWSMSDMSPSTHVDKSGGAMSRKRLLLNFFCSVSDPPLTEIHFGRTGRASGFHIRRNEWEREWKKMFDLYRCAVWKVKCDSNMSERSGVGVGWGYRWDAKAVSKLKQEGNSRSYSSTR